MVSGIQPLLTVVSTNIQGLLLNSGDLTHSFVIPHNVDIVTTGETFSSDCVPPKYRRIKGYSNWH